MMILAGFLSTMNVWVDKVSHMYLSLNDVYMVGLMTGWMLLFMGLWYGYGKGTLVGLLLVLGFFVAIRTQAFVDQTQFLRGMIPHHSMAITMSKQLRSKDNTIQPLLDSIINTQKQEIQLMEQYLMQRTLP